MAALGTNLSLDGRVLIPMSKIPYGEANRETE